MVCATGSRCVISRLFVQDFRAYDWILSNGGMAFKENYGPYLMQDGYCRASKMDISIQQYINVTEFSEPALMDALASVGPVSISIDASHPGLSFYTGGVYYGQTESHHPAPAGLQWQTTHRLSRL
jgi:hypothetical protein